MKSRSFLFLAALLSLLLVFSAVGCGGDDDDDNNASDDDDDDTYLGDDDDNDDNDDLTPPPGDWDGVSVTDVEAPDQYTVEVQLSASPGAAAAANANIYTITSDYGSLNVQDATFAKANVVTLTTGKQKLGVEYTLTIEPTEYAGEPLTGAFPAADTARFWTWDFATGDQYQITAYRGGIGETCVVYVESGQSVADVAHTIEVFDDQVYPIETELFTEAPDVDGNGRILILGLDGGEYFGGYFSGVNQYSDDESMSWWGLHSNEADMVHVNSLYGSLMVENVVPHEFQHLLYNAEHGNNYEYWEYHDEGLAEAAVHAVFGIHQGALDYYLADPEQEIGNGLSLVHWVYANYDNYVQAYLWWIYLAGRLDGIDSLADIFHLENGNPNEVDDFIATELGSTMVDEVIHYELAAWLQEESGAYGFNGMLSWTPGAAPTVAVDTTSVDLEPFGGTLFRLAQTSVEYPGTQGTHIVYYGVDGDGNIDDSEPFDVDGGALLVYNSSDRHITFPSEHSGPDLPALGSARAKGAPINPAWLDPPPIHPERLDRLAAWRYRTLERIRRSQ
ncbi:MAG: hypothetical protein P9L99_02280 [Candidatus Lernaella stagnicola]|nr:hypothetical protein [Candidatus Lernaella stagnicola]